MSHPDWLDAVSVSVVEAHDVPHYGQVAAAAPLSAILYYDWPGMVAHWMPYTSRLERRLKKRRCQSTRCDRHEGDNLDDNKVPKHFSCVVGELDVLKQYKATANAQTFEDLVDVVVTGLDEEAPNVCYASKSYGPRLIWVLGEPVTDGRRYEQIVAYFLQLLRDKIGEAISPLAEVDKLPADWTRLWRACRVEGYEKDRKTQVVTHIDTISTPRPVRVIHDRLLDPAAVAVIEVPKVAVAEISDLDRHRVALAPARSKMRRAISYLRKMPPAITGECGSRDAVRAASECWGFGLTEAEALTALQSEWNERCDPPLDERELERKVEHAYTTQDPEKAWGWRLGEAKGSEPSGEQDEDDAEVDEIVARMDASTGVRREQEADMAIEMDTNFDPAAPAAERPGALEDLRAWRDGEGPPLSYDVALALHRKISAENAALKAEAAGKKPSERADILAGLVRGPELYELLLFRTPDLICTVATDNKREWLIFDPASGWKTIVNIKDLVRSVFSDAGVEPTSGGYRSKVNAAAEQLGGERSVASLSIGEPCVISGEGSEREALPLPETEIKTLMVGDESLIVVRPDGTWGTTAHSPALYAPVRLGCDPRPGDTPFIDTVLETVFRGDRERIDAFLDWCAYCLTPGNDAKKFLLLVSAGGSGKTTLLYILRSAVGSHNATAHDDRALADRFFHDGLRTSLVNISEEINPYGKQIESTIKAATGGSAMSWAVKFGAIGSYIPQWKIVIATNDDPTLVDDSGAYASRMILLKTSPIASEDIKVRFQIGRDLEHRLEGERAQFINALLDRLADIHARGLTIPAENVEDVRRLRLLSSPVLEWWEEMVEEDEGGWVSRDDLYSSFRRWVGNGEKPMARQTFLRKFKAIVEGAERIDRDHLDADKKRPIEFGGGRDGPRDRGCSGIRLLEPRVHVLSRTP